jgi:hypothetical protein
LSFLPKWIVTLAFPPSRTAGAALWYDYATIGRVK